MLVDIGTWDFSRCLRFIRVRDVFWHEAHCCLLVALLLVILDSPAQITAVHPIFIVWLRLSAITLPCFSLRSEHLRRSKANQGAVLCRRASQSLITFPHRSIILAPLSTPFVSWGLHWSRCCSCVSRRHVHFEAAGSIVISSASHMFAEGIFEAQCVSGYLHTRMMLVPVLWSWMLMLLDAPFELGLTLLFIVSSVNFLKDRLLIVFFGMAAASWSW